MAKGLGLMPYGALAWPSTRLPPRPRPGSYPARTTFGSADRLPAVSWSTIPLRGLGTGSATEPLGNLGSLPRPRALRKLVGVRKPARARSYPAGWDAVRSRGGGAATARTRGRPCCGWKSRSLYSPVVSQNGTVTPARKRTSENYRYAKFDFADSASSV